MTLIRLTKMKTWLWLEKQSYRKVKTPNNKHADVTGAKKDDIRKWQASKEDICIK